MILRNYKQNVAPIDSKVTRRSKKSKVYRVLTSSVVSFMQNCGSFVERRTRKSHGRGRYTVRYYVTDHLFCIVYELSCSTRNLFKHLRRV